MTREAHISPIGPIESGRAVGLAKADPIRGVALRVVLADSAKRTTSWTHTTPSRGRDEYENETANRQALTQC